MNHNLDWWTDVVQGLAKRRLKTWCDRLGHDVSYDDDVLKNIARSIMRAQVILDEPAAINEAEQGFLRIEGMWRQEWAARQAKHAA